MEKLISLYIDSPQWSDRIEVDDFVVAVGVKQSNSVYHVAEVRHKHIPEKRIVRNYIKCYRSDLITALKRDQDQKLFDVTWYKRKKKNGN